MFKNYSVRRATLDYNYAIKRDGVRITRGGSGMSEVTIPAEIDGQRVVCIDINAFKEKRRLKTVTVEANLKEVASGAFSKNTKLSQVIFKGSVEAFSRSCFEGCNELSTIKLPEGTKAIRSRVFANCRKLGRVVIPASVTFIDETAFLGSPNVVICCKKDSEAYRYAHRNKIKFELI